MKRITVADSGFGALSTLRELRHRDENADITLIAPRAELIYSPGLIWIPAGLRNHDDLLVNIIDRLGKGMLVYRNATLTIVTLPGHLLHVVKRQFKKRYLSRCGHFGQLTMRTN